MNDNQFEPVLVEDLKKKKVIYISAGSQHSAALLGA
jgi:hypothetical protein